MNRFAVLPLLLLSLNLFGQVADEEPDSTRVLEEVVVEAYQSHRSVQEVPASIGVVDAKLMNRFANTSFVSATNTIPGVRM